MSHHRLSTPPGIIVPPWWYYMTLVEQASLPGDPPGVVPPWRYHMTLVEQASVPGDVQPRYCSTMALPYDVGGTRLGFAQPARPAAQPAQPAQPKILEARPHPEPLAKRIENVSLASFSDNLKGGVLDPCFLGPIYV